MILVQLIIWSYNHKILNKYVTYVYPGVITRTVASSLLLLLLFDNMQEALIGPTILQSCHWTRGGLFSFVSFYIFNL